MRQACTAHTIAPRPAVIAAMAEARECLSEALARHPISQFAPGEVEGFFEVVSRLRAEDFPDLTVAEALSAMYAAQKAAPGTLFLWMVPDSWSHDLRHDAIVAILEGCPRTSQEAQTLIDRVRYRTRYAQRAGCQREVLLDADPAAESGDPLMQEIRIGLDGLDEHDRSFVELHYIQGASTREIAIEMQVDRRTVRRRLARAEKKLREAVRSCRSQRLCR